RRWRSTTPRPAGSNWASAPARCRGVRELRDPQPGSSGAAATPGRDARRPRLAVVRRAGGLRRRVPPVAGGPADADTDLPHTDPDRGPERRDRRGGDEVRRLVEPAPD